MNRRRRDCTPPGTRTNTRRRPRPRSRPRGRGRKDAERVCAGGKFRLFRRCAIDAFRRPPPRRARTRTDGSDLDSDASAARTSTTATLAPACSGGGAYADDTGVIGRGVSELRARGPRERFGDEAERRGGAGGEDDDVLADGGVEMLEGGVPRGRHRGRGGRGGAVEAVRVAKEFGGELGHALADERLGVGRRARVVAIRHPVQTRANSSARTRSESSLASSDSTSAGDGFADVEGDAFARVAGRGRIASSSRARPPRCGLSTVASPAPYPNRTFRVVTARDQRRRPFSSLKRRAK